MSRSYNGWDPNSHRHADSAADLYERPQGSRPSTRLPPPVNIVAGPAPSGDHPAGHSSSHPHPHVQPQPQPQSQSHPYCQPPTRPLQPHPHPHPHQNPSHGPNHRPPPFPAPQPAQYAPGHAAHHHMQHYPPPGHISPSPSQASNASSASFHGPRAYPAPQGQQQQQQHPPYPPYGQPRPQQSASYPQPPPSISSSASSAMGQRPSGPSTDPAPARVRCLNLLGEDRAGDLEGIKFILKLRQHPQSARSCGFGDRDRRVIDPPPIVELLIEAPKLGKADITKYLRYPTYISSVQIYDEAGTQDVSIMSEEYRNQRRLMGTLVATPCFAKDEFDKDGCFFPFPDLSCRTPGMFRLRFDVVMLAPMPSRVYGFSKLAEVISEPFTVYNAKDFPGMVASSALARRLKDQGCIISIKKGADKLKMGKGGGNAANDDNSGNEDDDFDDGDDDGGSQGKGKEKRRG